MVLPQRYAHKLSGQHRDRRAVHSLRETYLRTVQRGRRDAGIHAALSAAVCVGVYRGRAEHDDLGVSVLYRAFVFNTLIIRGLPVLVGESIIWYTYGIAECAVLVLAVALLKYSERNGIVFKDPQY